MQDDTVTEICPECGSKTVKWARNRICNICGFNKPDLELHFDSGILSLGMTTILNMQAVKQFGKDSRFWDREEQMTLKKTAYFWLVSHNGNAQNETLLNGVEVKTKQVLKNGDKLAVGREKTGVIKMPITIKLF